MTRHQIISSTQQITKALTSAGIPELFESKGDALTLQDYLLAFKQYNILAEGFSEGALFLEKELGFSKLRDPDPWIEMSKDGTNEGDEALNNLQGIITALSSISDLLVFDQPDHSGTEGKEVLTLIVLDKGKNHRGSSPKRISESIESIENLYEACARLQGLPFDDLEIVSCDSGNDKFFEFLGSQLIIGEVKALILSIWERVIFYRNRNIQERISLLTHALPALDNISELEMKGDLSSSDSQLIRNTMVDGVKKFISSNALIQEIRERRPLDERTLIPESTPEPKKVNGHHPVDNGHVPPKAPQTTTTPLVDYSVSPRYQENSTETEITTEILEDDLSWDGILEDDLKTLRELIDKTKRNEEEPG